MKILHVTLCKGGGVPVAIAAIVAATPEHEHYVAWRESVDDLIADSSAKSFQLSGSVLRDLIIIRTLVHGVKPAVIHTHSSVAGLLVRLARLGPVVYQPHCFYFENTQLRRLKRLLSWYVEKVLSRGTRAIIAITVHERDTVMAFKTNVPVYLVPNSSILPHNGTSTFQPSGLPEDGIRRADGPTVIMAGRISDQKDPEFFAAVARRVRRVRPEVQFRWIGQGDEHGTASLKKAGVKISGWLSASDVAFEMRRASLYFHSAKYEGFPLSVLDAASQDLPILVRAISCFKSSGLLEIQDIDEAAAVILKLLSSEKELESVRFASRALVLSMNQATQRDALVALYRDLVGAA